jgi:hypothetical protein
MFKYNLDVYNKDIRPDVNKINNLVYENNGKLFGGYVRNHIVYKNEFINCSSNINLNSSILGIINRYLLSEFDCNDIDIWFTEYSNYIKFIKQIKKHYNTKKINLTLANEVYSFKVERYMIYNKNCVPIRFPCFPSGFVNLQNSVNSIENIDWVFFIDICVYPYFPCNDFTINLLSFDGKCLKFEKYRGFDELNRLNASSISSIVNHIKYKKLVLLPYFNKYIFNRNKIRNDHDMKENIMIGRYEKFINNGYILQSN